MKKLIIFLLVFVMLFTVACEPGETPPSFPDITPGGTPTPGPSGSTPSGSNPSGSTPSGSNPSGTVPSIPSGSTSEITSNYYTVTISLSEQNGKMTKKNILKSEVTPLTTNLPLNANSYPFVSPSVPKNIYELPFSYNFDAQTSTDSLLTMFASYNASSIEERVANFIRYIYCMTDGKLLISVTYDTSAIYQTKSSQDNELITGGFVMRARIKAEKCTLDSSYSTFNSVFYATAPFGTTNTVYSYTKFFSNVLVKSYPFVFTPITTNNLSEGAECWGDVFIGMPLLETQSGLWDYINSSFPDL